MVVRLEHANICVRNIEGMIGFLQTAFPEFRVRGEGVSNDGTRWVHIGTDETYLLHPEGNDWEFVQYLSQDPAERNDYKLRD